MKVIERQHLSSTLPVGHVRHGTVVKFLQSFHPDHRVDQPYLVCTAPEGYRPEHDRFGSKVPVAHLRTGKISYVRANRDVYGFDAEVHIAGPKL